MSAPFLTRTFTTSPCPLLQAIMRAFCTTQSGDGDRKDIFTHAPSRRKLGHRHPHHFPAEATRRTCARWQHRTTGGSTTFYPWCRLWRQRATRTPGFQHGHVQRLYAKDPAGALVLGGKADQFTLLFLSVTFGSALLLISNSTTGRYPFSVATDRGDCTASVSSLTTYTGHC